MKFSDALLVCALALVLNNPFPSTAPKTSGGALKTAVSFETLYADLLDDAAGRLDKREFMSDGMLNDFLKSRTAAAWNLAVRDGIAAEMQAALGGNYTQERAASLCREWSKQLRSRLQ